MTNITQGQNLSGDPKGRSSASRRGPRRSVLIGSIGSLVLGVILSTTALPAVADVVSPSTTFGVGTTTTTSATTTTVAPTTTTTLKKVRRAAHVTATSVARHSHVVASSTTHHARSNPNGSSSPTTTTPPPTTVVTPTTVAPTPTTTIKPVTKAPAPSISNPSANIAPSPNFLAPGACSFVSGVWSCANPCVAGTATALSWPGYTNGVACTNYILAAINHARAVEGVRPMVLPSNWFSLSVPEQLFVLMDLERTARGLPAYLGINAALSADTQHAAATNSDPSIAAGFAMANDAQGSAGVLMR